MTAELVPLYRQHPPRSIRVKGCSLCLSMGGTLIKLTGDDGGSVYVHEQCLNEKRAADRVPPTSRAYVR